MSVASIPSPSRGVWHLGPVPVRAYALCIVLGVIVAVWITGRRYRAAGGKRGVVADVATWAVPFGLVGARLYSVLTDYELYFGGRRDWVNVLKVWDGGLGMPGGIALGLAGAWIACRRAGVALGPVAGAAAPAIAIGQAIGRWGNWFNQELYGRPSTLPWALQISPAHRLPGYESFATFQPAFLYESVWDLLTAVVVIWVARRSHLAGDRAFALYIALYSAGVFITQSVRIDPSHHFAGLRLNQWVALATFAIAVLYLRRTHPAHRLPGQHALTVPAPGSTAEPGTGYRTPSGS